MRNVVIIGAGELGSRHLQGLLKVTSPIDVYVLDPSSNSLEIAKKRADEISHSHSLKYSSDWNDLPKEIDLVILATGANVREKVVTQLLEGFKVFNLVLEKILFQNLESYTKIEALIKKTNTPTWVNHPRRMMQHYQQIRNEIIKSGESIVFNVVGGYWGLACNSLHFIDLCSFLTGQPVQELDFNWLDNEIHESKRANYIEFTGSLKGKMKGNSNFVITSFNGDAADITVTIVTKTQRWIVQEGRAQKIFYLSKEKDYHEVITSFTTEYQSSLTTSLVNDLFQSSQCNLPSYEEACVSHIPFIEASLKKYNELTGENTKICPIT